MLYLFCRSLSVIAAAAADDNNGSWTCWTVGGESLIFGRDLLYRRIIIVKSLLFIYFHTNGPFEGTNSRLDWMMIDGQQVVYMEKRYVMLLHRVNRCFVVNWLMRKLY